MAKESYGADALNPEVAKEYELVNWEGGHRQNFGKWTQNFKDTVLDLSTLTLAQAAKLVEKGFPKLRKKQPVSAPPAKKEEK